MKIRSQINLLFVFMALLLGLAGWRLVVSSAEVAAHDADLIAVTKLNSEISHLRFIMMETILYREDRPRQLWGKKLTDLKATLLFHSYELADQNRMATRIANDIEKIETLYNRLLNLPYRASSAIVAGTESDELGARTVSAMLVVTQDMLDNVTEICRLNREAVLQISSRRQWVTLGGVLLLAVFGIVLVMVVRRNVLQPITRLQRGTEVIAAGDLGHRVGKTSENEIGTLAETFDAMTNKLQQSMGALQAEIEEREAAQNQLSAYSDQLADDLVERERLERLKTEFISVVSHELRTPLTSIRGSLGLLDGGVAGELSPQAQNLVRIAHSNSERLAVLVNDILDMDKLISGKMAMNLTRTDLVALAGQAIEANAAYAGGFEVSYQLAGDPPEAAVMADASRLMQVFANYMSNAARFSPRGGTVFLHIVRRGAMLRLEVEDQGPGIPANFRARVFQAFAQANASATREQGGTGLGLKITKALVEEMGGKVGFESEEGKGAVFWFELPALD